MKLLIFYTKYDLKELIKKIKIIFKIKDKISITDFIEYNTNIYIYNNQDIIQNIINSSVKVNNKTFTKYNLIQILYLETIYIDCFDIINCSTKYLIEHSKNICYIPENININEISSDTEFIILKLNLIKLVEKYSYDLKNLNNVITNYHIFYNKDRLDFNDELIDVICIWSYVENDMLQNLENLNKYFNKLNIKITEDNYVSSMDEYCCLLYDLKLNPNQYSLFSKDNLEKNIFSNIKNTFHLVIKRKSLKYIEFERGYIHERSGDSFPYDYYIDNYILSNYDYENCDTYGTDTLGDEILILSKKYEDDVKFFDIIQ